VANIFALFFSQPSQIPVLSGRASRFCNNSSVYSARALETDRRIDGNAISIAGRLLRNAR